MSRVVLIDEDLLEFSYEELNGQPYVHFVVSGWTASLKRECLEHMKDIKQYFKEEGYTKMYTASDNSNKKLQKFVKLFGFTLEQELVCYRLYSQEIL